MAKCLLITLQNLLASCAPQNVKKSMSLSDRIDNKVVMSNKSLDSKLITTLLSILSDNDIEIRGNIARGTTDPGY